MKSLQKYLLIGIISTIPAIITIQVILFLYNIIFGLIKEIHGYANTWENTFFSILILFVFFILIGQSVSKYGTSTYIKVIDMVAEKLPFISKVYHIAKKIINMFFKEKEEFSEIVFVEYPRRGVWVPAYITNRFDNTVVLFVPTSPIPSSGFAVIVKTEEIIEVSMSVEEATSFIVSVGASIDRKELQKELDLKISEK